MAPGGTGACTTGVFVSQVRFAFKYTYSLLIIYFTSRVHSTLLPVISMGSFTVLLSIHICLVTFD